MALPCWHPEVLSAQTSQMAGVGEDRLGVAVLSVWTRVWTYSSSGGFIQLPHSQINIAQVISK